MTRYVIPDVILSPTGERGAGIGLGTVLRRPVCEAQRDGEIRAELDPDEVAQAITGAYLAVFLERASQSRSAASGESVSVSHRRDAL